MNNNEGSVISTWAKALSLFGNNSSTEASGAKSRAPSETSSEASTGSKVVSRMLKTGPYKFTIQGPLNAPTGLTIESSGMNERYSRNNMTYDEGLEEVRSWNTTITNADSTNVAKKKYAIQTAKEAFEEWIKTFQQGGGRRRRGRRSTRRTRRRRSTRRR